MSVEILGRNFCSDVYSFEKSLVDDLAEELKNRAVTGLAVRSRGTVTDETEREIYIEN